MPEFYDNLEIRSTHERTVQQFAQLSAMLPGVISHSPYYRQLLTGFAEDTTIDAQTLEQIPLTRKSDLQELQRDKPPFGGLAELSAPELMRIFASPGPIYEPQTRRRDGWRFARALHAAGLRPGDLLHNCFSYHFTPAGAMVESGAFALGCSVFPAGTGQTELQAQTIAELRPQAYVGTPSFLKLILDKAGSLDLNLESLGKALVSGEYLTPELRSAFAACEISVRQCYATADLGLIAYETAADQGMVLDEGVIVEIVRPGTSEPVPEGEVGEVVVTSLTPEYPLIRLATGDLSAILPGLSPCGRTNRRIKGWLGRADQSAKFKGLFVHPCQIATLLARYPETGRGRLIISSNCEGLDDACLHVECGCPDQETLIQTLKNSFQQITRLRVEIVLCRPGSLANDGRVIDDQRPQPE